MAHQSTFSKSNFIHPHISHLNHQPDRNLSVSTQIIPTVQQSGYIIGAPIAYTNQPFLPSHLQPHTPKNVLIQSPVNAVSQFVNPPQFIPPKQQHISSSKINFIQKPVQVVRQQMVSRELYDRSVSECKKWQMRYNQLYNENIMLKKDEKSLGYMQVKRQNEQLRRRLYELQRNEDKLYENLELRFSKLVDKYRQSTLKECMLLTDRYRLQKRYEQKF